MISMPRNCFCFTKFSKIKQLYLIYFIAVFVFFLIYRLRTNEKLNVIECRNDTCVTYEKYLENYVELTEREIDFHKDVLAFVHIQKTSGTFLENSIISNLQIFLDNVWEHVCVKRTGFKRMVCYKNRHRKTFFWDRYVTKLCDIHADYTELKNCIMYDYGNRIKISGYYVPFYGVIHFITMLRDPVQRYISEFRHVKRGATWEKSVRVCNDELLYRKNCTKAAQNITWSQFLTCEHNQANNRMTRMLANYNQLGCRALRCWTSEGGCSTEEKQVHDKMLLESAKQTLLSISFFGLAEYQSQSQYLFEKTFKDKMKFSKPLIETKNSSYELSDEYKNLSLIKQNNNLDLQLYEFAKDLFFRRIEYLKQKL